MDHNNYRPRILWILLAALCSVLIESSCTKNDTGIQPDDNPAKILPVILADSVIHRFGDKAVLTARVDLNGSEAEYWFEYGKDSITGNSTKRITLAKDTGFVDITDTLAPLSYNTQYYYRLKVANSKGIASGSLRTFYSPAVDMSVMEKYQSNGVSQHGAYLYVEMNARSQEGMLTIELGESSSYGTTVSATKFTPGQKIVASHALNGLRHSTTYHWRCVVVTDSGTIATSDSTFTTTIINAPVEFSYPLDSGKVFYYEYSLQVSGIGGQNPPGLQRKGERIVQVKSHKMENDTLFWELECAAFDTVLTRVGQNLPPDTSYDRRVITFTIKRSSLYYHVGIDKITEYAKDYRIGPLPRIIESGTAFITIGEATYKNGFGLHFYQSGFIGSGGGYIERLYLRP